MDIGKLVTIKIQVDKNFPLLELNIQMIIDYLNLFIY